MIARQQQECRKHSGTGKKEAYSICPHIHVMLLKVSSLRKTTCTALAITTVCVYIKSPRQNLVQNRGIVRVNQFDKITHSGLSIYQVYQRITFQGTADLTTPYGGNVLSLSSLRIFHHPLTMYS